MVTAAPREGAQGRPTELGQNGTNQQTISIEKKKRHFLRVRQKTTEGRKDFKSQRPFIPEFVSAPQLSRGETESLVGGSAASCARSPAEGLWGMHTSPVQMGSCRSREEESAQPT